MEGTRFTGDESNRYDAEPVFLNFYGALESIPLVCSLAVPSRRRLLKNSTTGLRGHSLAVERVVETPYICIAESGTLFSSQKYKEISASAIFKIIFHLTVIKVYGQSHGSQQDNVAHIRHDYAGSPI